MAEQLWQTVIREAKEDLPEGGSIRVFIDAKKKVFQVKRTHTLVPLEEVISFAEKEGMTWTGAEGSLGHLIW